MKRALIVAAALLLLAGCSSSAPEPAPTGAETTTIAVELDMTVTVNGDGSVSVSATTNLPDGTELGSSVFQEGAFMAQDSQTVQGGAASFGPFSDGGSAIPSGTYDVSVTMPIAGNQPDAVREIIGQAGENLAGPLVSKNEITGDAVVSVSEPLTIP